MAAKSSKWLQESLELRKKSLISNLTLKIESPIFKNYISLQFFQQEVLEFDTITSINPCYPEGFSQAYFPKGVVATPWIINTEGHITLNLLPVYRYGHPLSIDTKLRTNH